LQELNLDVGFESNHASLDHFIDATIQHLQG
jgi:hypothetical protein